MRALIRNFIWSWENGKRNCHAKLEWNPLILPENVGSLKLVDRELEIHALLAKLFIKGLMSNVVPWHILIKHRM